MSIKENTYMFRRQRIGSVHGRSSSFADGVNPFSIRTFCFTSLSLYGFVAILESTRTANYTPDY